MEEDRDEEIAQKWIQSTDEAMPEDHIATGLFSYIFSKSSRLLNQFELGYFPYKPICMLTSRVVCV